MSGLLLSTGILEDLGINPLVLGVQIIIFITTFIVLRRLLFGRMMAYMIGRETEVQGDLDRLSRSRAELEKRSAEYEAHIARIEKEAYDRMQAVLKEGLEEKGRISAKAQHVAAAEVKAAIEAIGHEKKSALAVLQKEVQAISRQAVERVIGVPVDAKELDRSLKNAGGAP